MDTDIIIKKIKENRNVAIATGAIIVLVILLLITSYKGESMPVPVAGPVDINGEFACLPFAKNVPEEKCTLGVKDGGNYYAMDVSAISLAVSDLKANEDIEVKGDFLPIEQLSSENWKKFDIVGIIKVDSLTRGR